MLVESVTDGRPERHPTELLWTENVARAERRKLDILDVPGSAAKPKWSLVRTPLKMNREGRATESAYVPEW
jgi:hypothetical protein